MAFCRHPKKEFAFRSRHYATLLGIECHFWQDYIIGLECPKCEKLFASARHLDIGYPYVFEGPHYPKQREGEKNDDF